MPPACQVVMIGDGQVSVGPVMVKPNVRKVRRIGETVVVGFAGSAADGMSLLERLELKLEQHPAVGSGGNFALAAARALIDVPGMDALTIAKKSMRIAADMCIYTNDTFTIETIKLDRPATPAGAAEASTGASYP
ncbi:ATP-dependent protease subunit HslV [Tetrabaena socialis]|uniref:ATP-dependent protease subunit HslV n=1 Tax=Tetrabaena socialis TaxID=47790 RepID=A0A2J7ZTJ5_9CHLO|nr:ATP-dependent protease subunit HslV [Tetrabaena socialis]|eukprot:PNH03594.1 ATP-dependent protease subunit HslV [Tetrabaena socialis]